MCAVEIIEKEGKRENFPDHFRLEEMEKKERKTGSLINEQSGSDQKVKSKGRGRYFDIPLKEQPCHASIEKNSTLRKREIPFSTDPKVRNWVERRRRKRASRTNSLPC